MNGQSVRAGQSLGIYSIGPKIRALRKQRGLTLSRLAADTCLSTALLSKLETNQQVPTLPTLLTISGVFGVGLSFFFAEPSRHSVSITRKAPGVGHERAQGALKVTPLNLSVDARLLARVVEFPTGFVGTLTEVGTPVACVVYVLEGSLQLGFGGAQELLEAGGCVCLETEMLVTWTASGMSSCRALVVTPGA
jgi:transcriptional regulator with XRE-family HTH domain